MRFLSNILLAIFLLNAARGECGQIQQLYGLRNKEALLKILKKKKAELKSNPDDIEIIKSLGIVYHNLGVLKVHKAPQEAVKYLKRVNKLVPNDYEVLAYLGSAKTMIARDSWNPIRKISYANEGIKLIDKAVYKDPDNIVIRFIRVNNSLSLPKFFKRNGLAKKDLLYLLGLSRKREKCFTSAIMAEIYFYLGNIYFSEGTPVKAKEYWKRAVKVAPDSKWGKRAKGEL